MTNLKRPQFELIDGDGYDARCGEIYITLKRDIAFHCTLCEHKYGIFAYFLEHLNGHYKNIQEFMPASKCDNDEADDEKDYFLDEAVEEYLDESQEPDCPDVSAVDIEETYLKLDEEEADADSFHSSDWGSETNDGCDDDDVIESDLVHGVEFLEEEFSNEDTSPLDEPLLEYITVQHRSNEKTSSSSEKHKGINKNPISRYQTDGPKCDICNKVFRHRRSLQQHMKIHASERKHKCHICGFAFKTRTNMNAHVRRHAGVKKYSCDICAKRFFTSTETAIHKRVHTGETPYMCTLCGLAFKTSSKLNAHNKKHAAAATTFKCTFCDKTFSNKSSLTEHLHKHAPKEVVADARSSPE